MKRDHILLSTLYLVDEDILDKDLILYLDRNVSRENPVTPSSMMSTCFMFWATSPKAEPSNEKIEEVRGQLTKALEMVWKHYGRGHWIEKVSVLQKNKMKGWRISYAHRLKKLAEIFKVPVK